MVLRISGEATTRRGMIVLTASAALTSRARAASALVRVGALRFGTVSSVLDVVAHHRLAEASGIAIETLEFAGTSATQVALQAGRVDIVVADWLWVARLRASGANDPVFTPFSAALGGLVVPPGSAVAGAEDLRGLRLGVAGSPLDKSWLLLRVLCRRRSRFDPQDAARPAFGAPPLLNEQLVAGRLDAVLTYWPFVARLEARGLRTALPMSRVLARLGFAESPPMLGWTFPGR